MAPPSGTTPTTTSPAPAPPSPSDARGRPSRSAGSGGWRRQRCRSGRRLGSPGQPPPKPGRRPGDPRRTRRPPPPARLRAIPLRPRRGPWADRGSRTRPQHAAPRPRPQPLARRQRGGWPRRQPQAHHQGPLLPQRRAGRVHKELRPRPRRAARPPQPATPRPPARRWRRGRTPRGLRAPGREPPQPQRVAGRARSTAPTPTPTTPTPAPPSRSPLKAAFPTGHAARITALRTLSWSSGAAQPPGGTSRFPPSLRRSTASKGRFLIPLVVPEQAQLSHPYTSTTRGRSSPPRGSGPCPSPGPRAGSPLPPAPAGAGVGGVWGDEVNGFGVDVVEVGVVVVVVVGVVRRHLLDAGGHAPHRLHVRLRGRLAPRPPPFPPPSPLGPRAPPCLSLSAHGALALALRSLPGPYAFVPLSAPWVPPPVTCALGCTAGARTLPVPVSVPLAVPTLADRAPFHSIRSVTARLGALLALLRVLPCPCSFPAPCPASCCPLPALSPLCCRWPRYRARAFALAPCRVRPGLPPACVPGHSPCRPLSPALRSRGRHSAAPVRRPPPPGSRAGRLAAAAAAATGRPGAGGRTCRVRPVTGSRRGRLSWRGGRCSASQMRMPTTGSPGLCATPSPTGATTPVPTHATTQVTAAPRRPR